MNPLISVRLHDKIACSFDAVIINSRIDTLRQARAFLKQKATLRSQQRVNHDRVPDGEPVLNRGSPVTTVTNRYDVPCPERSERELKPDSNSDGGSPLKTPVHRGDFKNMASRKRPRRTAILDSESDSEFPLNGPTDPRAVNRKPSRKRAKRAAVLDIDSNSSDIHTPSRIESTAHCGIETQSEDDHDDAAQSPSCKEAKGPRPELTETDEDDLSLSDDATKPKARSPNAFQKAMEKLRARKQGIRDAQQDSLFEASDQEGNLSDDSGDGDESGGSANSGLGDFVVDYNSDHSEVVHLPVEFRLVSQTLFDSFRIFIQLLVQSVIEPGCLKRIQNHEDCHVRALDNRLSGYKLSLVASAAWHPDFKRVLDQLPNFHSSSDTIYGENCEACRRSNRPASRKVVLIGKLYDLSTLEEENSDAEFFIFYLGRFCHARSRLYHELQHFKWTMHERVRNEVSRDDVGKSQQQILDELETDGTISELWAYFEDLIERAEAYAAS